MAIIDVKNLRKEYRVNKKKEGLRGALSSFFRPVYETKVAVNGLTFSIEKGEPVGYIGANGAGKSTTIKMLTGILTPTSGQVKVNGLVPYKNRIKNNMQIGVVFGQRVQLWWDTPVIESYRLIQKIYEVPEARYKKNLEMFTELLDLKGLLGIPVRQLSLGQKMRCEIGAAFIHDPKIVYLDEPTIGLDVMVKENIRGFIKAINKERDVTVFLTTHDLKDIEEICKRVIIVDSGNIVYDGGLTEIKDKFGKYRVIQFKIKNISEDMDKFLHSKRDRLEVVLKENYDLHIRFNKEDMTAASVMEAVSPYCEIQDLTIQEPSIESIVKDLYRK